jgi:Ca2+-binding RTX toxin-like protein
MTRLTHLTLLTTAVLVLAIAFAAEAGAASRRGAAVKVAQSSLGRILVDVHGRTLYLSTHDKRRASSCYGTCARNWPPFTTHGKPRATSGARSALLGTTRRKDGRIQVTYHAHPLYYFAGDKRAGQTRGEGLSAFGGRWYAVSAAGTAVRTPKPATFEYAKLAHGVLAIKGTEAADRIALRLKAGKPDVLQVDVGDNGSADASFDRASIKRITIDARGGDDLVRVDDRNGVFTTTIPTTIDGGSGNDTIAGGSGAETLLGGDGNDSLDGNGGSDKVFLGAGDDTFVWDPGDGSDTVEGQDGTDVLRFNGADAAERIDLSANGNRLRLFRDVGTITMDTAGVELVDVNALGGADLVSVNDLSGTGVSAVNIDAGAGDGQSDQVIVGGTNGDDAINVDGDASSPAVSGLAARVAIQHQEPSDQLTVDGLGGNDRISAAALTAQIMLTLDGGAGDDPLAGAKGIETLRGGDGNDSVDGNGGNDLALLGAGDDTFVWDPGDGSDTVEGQDGADTMRFNGAVAAERIDLSANGSRLRLFRDVGAITMDTAGVERVDVNALDGADVVTTDDLSGTGVTAVNVDLAGALGGTAGDAQTDRVIVNATNGNDTVNVDGDANAVKVGGLAASVQIVHQEAASDRLELNTLGGADTVTAAGLAAGAIQFVVHGGAGDDTLAGGKGVETLLGGDGNDSLDGNGGNDVAFLGAGDDTFVWDPGDGSDTVEGQDGADTLRFNGASVAERISLSANGNRLKLLRDPGRITMDTAGVERVDVNTLGGADEVFPGDLTGTGVNVVNLDLGADGEVDDVFVDGTDGSDAIDVAGAATGVSVTGLSPRVTIQHQEADDQLAVAGRAGNDSIVAPNLSADVIALTLDGGTGDDELFGGRGSEQLLGGDGDDVVDGFKGDDLALLGAGDDTFAWDPGDGSDTIEGQDGIDTMSFIGANLAEQIDLSAIGNRLRFHRDLGNVTMDTAGVEEIDFEALGGADVVTVNDLSGTDVFALQVDLEGTPGAGDGQPDRIVVNGTNGDDAIEVRGNADAVKIGGLAPIIVLLHPEAAQDRLELNTLDGTDTVNSDGLAVGAIQLLVDGVPAP